MRFILILFVCITAYTSCTNNDKTNTVPPAPTSVSNVLTSIKGKQYKVHKMGLHSSFTMDTINPINWDSKDTSSFYKNFEKNQLEFTISFNSDSIANFTLLKGGFSNNAANTQAKGVFNVDNENKKGYDDEIEKSGIKIRLVYIDSIDFGGNKTASTITQSYLVTGINDKELLLETSSEFNRQKVILWMKSN